MKNTNSKPAYLNYDVIQATIEMKRQQDIYSLVAIGSRQGAVTPEKLAEAQLAVDTSREAALAAVDAHQSERLHKSKIRLACKIAREARRRPAYIKPVSRPGFMSRKRRDARALAARS